MVIMARRVAIGAREAEPGVATELARARGYFEARPSIGGNGVPHALAVFLACGKAERGRGGCQGGEGCCEECGEGNHFEDGGGILVTMGRVFEMVRLLMAGE